MFPTKAELRDGTLKRRNSVDDEVRERFASRLAIVGAELVGEFATNEIHPVVSLFSPIGSEPDPSLMAQSLHAAGIRLALPVDRSHGSPLVYRSWNPGDRLSAGPLSIAEPLDDAAEVSPSILFIPCVAFDRRGNRLGYGAGNVDATLRKMRARRDIRVIGVAFSIQEVTLIPADANDEAVDMMVTEVQTLDFRT